jgi:hypothetical protein
MSNRIIIRIFILISGLNFGWNQCIEGVEVELWGECYNIEETTILDIYNQGLTGYIPTEIRNLTNLTWLNIGSNQLSGSIPPEIGDLTNLTHIFLDDNQLSGEIPNEIGNLSNLEYLRLNDNQLSGDIPSEIVNLFILDRLYLQNNQLQSIPDNFCDIYYNISVIYIHSNNLCLPYPECIEDNVGYQDTSECFEYQLGDVNMDGSIDILDIVVGINILLDLMEYTDEQYELLDYNQDGECNILDLVQLVNYILDN